MNHCLQCGAPLPPNAQFCPECGAITGFHLRKHSYLEDHEKGDTDDSNPADIPHTSIDVTVDKNSDVSDETMFQNAHSALNAKHYASATQLFGKFIARNPENEEGYYYLALSLLRGIRPRHLSRGTISQVEQNLQFAIRIDSLPHAFLLWAIVKEDFYTLNHKQQRPPTSDELIKYTEDIKLEKLTELLMHVKAPGNQYWETAALP